MEAIEIQLEAKILDKIREVCTVPVVGFFETALDGEMKVTDATSVQVTVSPRQQMFEPHSAYQVSVEIRLDVEACESKGGGLFLEEFAAIAGLLETWATGDGCVALTTGRFNVHGMMQTSGGSLDYDPTVSQWNALWNCTITGCINNTTEEE